MWSPPITSFTFSHAYTGYTFPGKWWDTTACNTNQILTGFCGQYRKVLARGQKYEPSVSEVHAFDQRPIFSSIDLSNQLILGLLLRFKYDLSGIVWLILFIEVSFNYIQTLHVVSKFLNSHTVVIPMYCIRTLLSNYINVQNGFEVYSDPTETLSGQYRCVLPGD